MLSCSDLIFFLIFLLVLVDFLLSIGLLLQMIIRFSSLGGVPWESEREILHSETHGLILVGDDTEKSKIEEDALIKDGSTVWIGEETVELSCQEDEDGQNGKEKAALKLNGGDHSVRTDNETENSTDQIIRKEVWLNYKYPNVI